MEDIHIQQTKDIGVEVVFMGIRQENIFIIPFIGSHQYDEGCEFYKTYSFDILLFIVCNDGQHSLEIVD